MSKRTRPVVVLGDGPLPINTNPRSLSTLVGGNEPDVIAGWSPGQQPWLSAWISGHGGTDGPRLKAVMGGYSLTEAINSGVAEYIPLRLSALDRYLAWLKPDLAILPAVRRGRGYALRGSVGWQPSLIRHADRLVLELDSGAADIGLPQIKGEIASIREVSCSADVYRSGPLGAADVTIGQLAAALIPDDATVQLGIGRIGEAIAAAICKPVRVHSGLVCASLRDLADRGLLRSAAQASYDWGGEATAQMALDRNLIFGAVTHENHPGRLGDIARFVSFNTALQVGLDGAVNVETVGGRRISGIGGHADFCAGASRSDGGISIIALRSTDPHEQSTIVSRVDVVSTPRTDIDVVVTEHGVADLRGCSDAERSRRLIAVADPRFRNDLSKNTV
ncbi:acetyl-CoA hydrolase/transferase C-terminal domain-containing protein [Mycolicibacterium sp. CBMA 226]|uniref:acetyl-CoA hydrolase/transferase C-terminal domain-containing protein n=1 Tax=Mycolicibacterium sp. CBMA 226 TaxID=2606611 RepID=UPI0012DFCF23|nr:acetyl-CoA hydrolase/transferase C-terminal domain-containing protein [Mycolicibacterium sp. CBMA 226]MUL74514.1 hypothetical protein [Mycolicibacterium sp. CBMA 226]